eukprot:gnl/MRDRNA2_/MRDRNA2_36933_c0_seq1.p1 gnl/MRDRNA2_/MRDRNA2_36933_c0~~gnl/MRDRNA2_/MRDRNA2_36933_c0_seq1.p1  ORF type:complete len:889 (-),score=159.65 gnl/MRDRNA2_/MRDRNA2_36933_c0_seq1:170-2836(-)
MADTTPLLGDPTPRTAAKIKQVEILVERVAMLEKQLMEVNSTKGPPMAPSKKERTLGASELKFRSTLGTVFRCVLAVVVCSLPVFIPSVYNNMDVNYSGNIAGGVCLLVVFTIYQNLGITVNQAWQGFIGSGLGCVLIHLLNVWMPLGARNPDTYVPWIANLVNILFIFFNLWLNMAMNTKLFSICYFVYMMMEFQNPSSVAIFNDSWAINLDSYQAATWFTIIPGLIVSIFCMLVPYPLSASAACKSSAATSTHMLTKLIDDITTYFNGSCASVKIFQYETTAVSLRNLIGTLAADLDGSWWEHFDFGSKGQVRGLLTRHSAMMVKMCDNLFAMLACVSVEGFEDTHVNCMEKMKGPVEKLTTSVATLLETVTQAASDGDINPDERQELMDMYDSVKTSLSEFSAAFDATRKEIFPDLKVTSDLQSESFFFYTLSVYARYAMEYTDNLLNCPPVPKGFFKEIIDAFCATFDSNMLTKDPDHISFTVRNTISITICYYLGMFYLDYSGVVAGSASVLLSRFAGSAIVKNLGRLQAVCIGNIAPHIIVHTFGTACYAPRIVASIIAMAFWEVVTCYVYYSSPTYGYIGCLTAAFALSQLIYPCSDLTGSAADAAEATFEQAVFAKLTQTTMAVLIMTFVDTVLSRDRASSMAITNFLQGMLGIDGGYQAAFAERDEKGTVKTGQKLKARRTIDISNKGDLAMVSAEGERKPGFIAGKLSLAEFLGNECPKEPRYHRGPWPSAYFSSMVRLAYILRAYLNEMEHALMLSTGKYDDLIANIRGCPSFEKVKDDLMKTFEDVLNLAQVVLRNETGEDMSSMIDKLTALEGCDKLDEMPKLIDEINASDLAFPDVPPGSLEDDLVVRIHVILMIFDQVTYTLSQMVAASIKAC